MTVEAIKVSPGKGKRPKSERRVDAGIADDMDVASLSPRRSPRPSICLEQRSCSRPRR